MVDVRKIQGPDPVSASCAAQGNAQLLDHLKKGEMAMEAERLINGSSWMPEVLRRSDHAASEDDYAAERQGALNEEALNAGNVSASSLRGLCEQPSGQAATDRMQLELAYGPLRPRSRRPLALPGS